MALALAVACVLAQAPAGQALTLLDHDPAATQAVVRVDEGRLSARAEGTVDVQGADVGPELAPLAVELGPWRGFANTSTLNATGEGWLVLADGASGLVIPVTTSPGEDEASSQGNASGHEQQPGRDPQPHAGDASNQSSSPTEEAASPGAAQPEPAGGAAGTSEGPPGAWGLLGSPVGLALGVLAVGAFLVERWLQREPGGEEGPPEDADAGPPTKVF